MLCLVCKREEIERARKVPQPDEEIWNPHAPDCAFRPWYRIRYLDDHFVPPGCTCVMREILRNALLDHIAAWEKLKPIIGVEAFSIRGQAHLQEIQIAMRVLAGDLLPMLMNEPAPTPEEVARWFHEHYERIAKDVGYHTKLESRVPFDKLARIHQTLMTRTADAVLGEIRKVRGGQ
ncbi:MAG TPA: hypothetical protein VHJ19_13280 [Gammaproteobacteria bacterium]|nr:hypothetical protein [Gammaproteobacteria bacterium]